MQSLPRVLGPFSAVTVVVGSIIGSGIFLKPGVAAAKLDHFGLILGVWVVVGLVALCGSLALAELAAMLPQAGGPYIYLREAYGRIYAFLWGWTEFWVIRTGSLGALAAATVIYLNDTVVTKTVVAGELIRSGEWSQPLQAAIAVLIVVALSAANFIGTRWGAWVQNITSVIKVAFLCGLIALPFVLGKADTSLLAPIWPSEYDPKIWSGLGLAAIAVMWPYDGWINIGPVTEEIHHPQRNVPLALIVGMAIVIVTYVSVNVAYHCVLPLDTIRSSPAVASDMCAVLLGPAFGVAVALGVACSTFGAVNSNMMTGPRIYFAMARDGLLPKSICQVHGRFQTPANAILVQAAWTVALIIIVYSFRDKPLAAFNSLTDFVIFGGSIFYSMTVAAVFVLRWKLPDLPRPYRTWGYPVVPALYLLAFGAVMVSLVVETPYESACGIGLILAGVPVYFWAARKPA